MPRLVFILGLLVAPLAFYYLPYWQRVISIICIYALLAISFDFWPITSVGLSRRRVLCGIGAYLAALLNTKFDLSPLLTIPLSTVGGGVICTLLFLPCLPLRAYISP